MEPLRYADREGQTKWELLSDADKVWAYETPLGVDCPGCEAPLLTEADHAKHFIIYKGYRNLGYCPVKGRNPGW